MHRRFHLHVYCHISFRLYKFAPGFLIANTSEYQTQCVGFRYRKLIIAVKAGRGAESGALQSYRYKFESLVVLVCDFSLNLYCGLCAGCGCKREYKYDNK